MGLAGLIKGVAPTLTKTSDLPLLGHVPASSVPYQV